MAGVPIVVVNVSQVVASAPNTLQRTGAFVSQGATTLASGTSSLLTQLSDLAGILRSALTIVTITWASSVVTVQTAAAHGIPAGKVVQGVIAGVSPVGYDGTFPCTGVDTTHFTYPLASNPGAETALGTFQLEAVTELQAMADTFFSQGNSQAVYVLELGVSDTAGGVTALGTYLANPSRPFYSYLIPRTWDTESTAPTLFKQYEATTSKVYFFVTTTGATYTPWTTQPIKSCFLGIEAAGIPATEFSLAAAFQVTLATRPGPVSLVAPLALRYVSGVTPAVLTGPNAVTYKAAGLNWIGTGAEGGISNTLIVNGQMGDLRPWNYWFSVDWMIINQAQALAAAVINGSNNPLNPLYYNQQGIDRLQKTSQAVVQSGIAFGMVLATPKPIVTAIDFITYVTENPNDYAVGQYDGLGLTFTPARGFTQITINLVVTDIVTG